MRRNKKNVPDDSEEESQTGSGTSGSDATVYNPRTSNKKQPLPHQKRGRPVRRKNAKRAKVLDDSESDTSPQPSTSGLANNSQSSPNDSGNNSSESESEDSDYGPVKDVSLRKKNLSRGKSRPPKKVDNGKKQKAQNNSLNGGTSKKRSEIRKQPNTSNGKNTSTDAASNEQVQSLAEKLVYFVLVEDQKKYAIKRKAITTHVFKDETCSLKMFPAVLKKANTLLEKIYGMALMHVHNQKGSYLIVNILKRELGIRDYYDVPRLKQQQHGLILYLLTIIFMNGNVITEEELTKSLKPLGIDLTSKRLHPVFGDVKKYITTELVKQMYLSYELVSRDPPKYEIKWGARADQEFDKRDLLQFTCQIMADTTPESWKIQYNDAEASANPQVNGNR